MRNLSMKASEFVHRQLRITGLAEMFDHVLCKDTTVNIAYWNLFSRDLRSDGPGSYTVDGVAVTWALSDGNTVLTGSVAGLGEVIKVELTDESGGWQVTQSHAIDQGGTANTETDIDIVVPVTVSDGVAAPVASTITITVEDDSPIYLSEVDATPDIGSDTSFTGEFHYRIGGDEHIEWTTDNEIDITAVTGKVGPAPDRVRRRRPRPRHCRPASRKKRTMASLADGPSASVNVPAGSPPDQAWPSRSTIQSSTSGTSPPARCTVRV